MKRNAVNFTFISISGTIDVFGVIPRRLKYDAIADDATQGVYLYRPPSMAHVRTPIKAPLPGIFSLIQRNIYIGRLLMSVMNSYNVDITSLNGALL